MQFSPFGNQDENRPQVSDHPGFSHGLIEGMLVRRGIDRQNKTDKLNESYNKKLMDMQEQKSRDDVLQAALQAEKSRIDNQWAPELNQSQVDQRAAAASEHDSGTTLNEARTNRINELLPYEKTHYIRDRINAIRAKQGNVIDLSEPQVRDYLSDPDKYWSLDQKTRRVVDGAALDLGLPTPKKSEMSTFRQPKEATPKEEKTDPVAKEARAAFLKVMNNGKLLGEDKDAALATVAETYPDHVEAVTETKPGTIYGTNTTTKYRLKTPAAKGAVKDPLGILN